MHRVSRGLGRDRSRVEVLLYVYLAPRPLSVGASVGAVAEGVGLVQSVVSRHLAELAKAGLLRSDRLPYPSERSADGSFRPGGVRVIYSLTPLAERLLFAVLDDDTEEG
jgi:DNA-binding transcriptional ArsR family regulator